MKKIRIAKLGRVDYQESLELQEKLMKEIQSGEGEDILLLVEHPPVLTLGRSGKYNNVIVSEEVLKSQGVTIYEVSRGGDVTYHGPGQIVGYPIMDLKKHGRDIKDFVWKIEEVFIRLLKEEYGIEAHREEKKFTGVWIGEEKITAMGIAVKRWVTMHGFAFNVNTNLDHFKWIIPCGLANRGVTSLEKITGMTQDFERLNSLVINYFCQVFELERETVSLESLL
ncbi:MAG TPA: lipoyl(octanoyl) transferase LipB [Clostridiaceae bacterium]|jgi:lipoyl(octanoyl) transferase|nr:lipoyl(octanoyl) transferase LipB [Clostridiaceae bacterium]